MRRVKNCCNMKPLDWEAINRDEYMLQYCEEKIRPFGDIAKTLDTHYCERKMQEKVVDRKKRLPTIGEVLNSRIENEIGRLDKGGR